MKTKIQKAMNKAASHKEVDYGILRDCWDDVMHEAEEKYGFIENSDHATRYVDALRRGGFNSGQILQLLRIFIESQS